LGVFERFTEETREVIRRAQQEARAMGHGAVGTEHLVLALTGVDGGIVAEVFTELGITSGAVREQARTRLGPGPDRAEGGHVPFSPLAKRALELSLRESLACGDQNIRPEHFLLAVSGMGESGGSEILRALAASPDLIRSAVRERIRGPMVDRPIGSQSAPVPNVANPDMPPPLARPDRLLQMFLTVAGRRAWVEQRRQFGLADLLRVCAQDERAARPLGELGIDVDLLRERLRRPPPAA
jgi:ATP-dependent Clp protease ATP-binding subunit ClpA